MTLRAANQEDSVAFANIRCLHVLKQDAVVGWGSGVQSSGVSLVYCWVTAIFLIVEAVDREWGLYLGHGEVGELPVFLATATERTVTVDTCFHADACGSTVHVDVVEPYMLDVVGKAADRSAMTCTEVAVPDMDVLCIIVADHIVITSADVAVIDVHVASPDRDTVCIMGRLFGPGL